MFGIGFWLGAVTAFAYGYAVASSPLEAVLAGAGIGVLGVIVDWGLRQ